MILNEYILNYLSNLLQFLLMSSSYLLLGFFIAGCIKVMIPLEKIKKWFEKDSLKSVTMASLVGIPLPLCSCSVIPTAIALRQSGASHAATSSFLISTPESGVDSISLTYAIMDLPMTILRPLLAFISAWTAGILNIFFNPTPKELKKEICDIKKSCCHSKIPSPLQNQITKTTIPKILKSITQFAFIDLINDIAFWLVFGIVVGAFIQSFVPISFFQHLNGFTGRLLMILAGVPLYICASSSTPMAAAMIEKGMSPGTALIFLLVGPATNISNLIVLKNYIGKKGIVLNLIAIISVAFAASYLVDYLYENIFTSKLTTISHLNYNDHKYHQLDFNFSDSITSFSFIDHLSTIVLVLLLLKALTPWSKLYRQ